MVRVVVDWVVLVDTTVVLVAAATVVGSVLSVVAGFELGGSRGLGGTVETAGVTAVVASVPLVVDWAPPKRPKINGRR